MELPSNRLFNCKILAGIFALAFMILLPPSGYLDTAIDDLSMIVFFLLSVSVDKDDDNLITALFYFKLVVAIMVLLAYNGCLWNKTAYRNCKALLWLYASKLTWNVFHYFNL